MIKVGDKITYYDGYELLITDTKQCKLANNEMSMTIKIERPTFSRLQ